MRKNKSFLAFNLALLGNHEVGLTEDENEINSNIFTIRKIISVTIGRTIGTVLCNMLWLPIVLSEL
jgi:hypothetical protein